MSTVRISNVPNVVNPVEGQHYTVLGGSPQHGDSVRSVTPGGSVCFYRHTVKIPPTPKPLVLSGIAFQDIAEAGLGGGATGRARFGAILRAMSVSLDDEVLGIFRRYEKSITFEKSKVAAFLAILVAKAVANVTSQERTDILAQWPEA